MSQGFRQPEILEIAQRDGKVTVDGLAAHFGVTPQTIRRDLADLAKANKLERVHGGAILPSGTTNIQYDERRLLNAEAKHRIAQACARCIPNGSSVFLNIGTSTEAVAQQLQHHQNLLVVTNNLNVATVMIKNDSCETVLTGGRLRRADNGLIGSLATKSVQQFKFDYAVIGCSALDADGDLLDFDLEEVAVSQAIIAQSRDAFIVADNSKFHRTAPARIGSLSALTALFTDAPVVKSLADQCERWDTEIVYA